MENQDNILSCENGFVLVGSLLVLLLLVVIGIASLNTTTIELQIAGNEKVHNETFYAAEAGGELAVEVIEQNLVCPDGFTSTSTDGSGVDLADLNGLTRAYERNGNDLMLYQEIAPTTAEVCAQNDTDTSTNFEDVAYPTTNLTNGNPLNYMYIGGETQMNLGSSLQMAAGYEGKGKSAAGGGASKIYDIFSKNLGRDNSRAIIQIGWRTSEFSQFGSDYCP